MVKKSINGKEAKKIVQDFREQGLSDQEIYIKLKEIYFDKMRIAALIKTTITKENLNKYKKFNNILLILMGITIILKVWTGIMFIIQTGKLFGLIFILFLPILNLLFFYSIKRYEASSYKLLGILMITGFFQSLTSTNKLEPIDIFISFILMSFISGLSFFLSAKLFPNYSIKRMRKDENGDYILD
jgi:spore maturation protein SpmA